MGKVVKQPGSRTDGKQEGRIVISGDKVCEYVWRGKKGREKEGGRGRDCTQRKMDVAIQVERRRRNIDEE